MPLKTFLPSPFFRRCWILVFLLFGKICLALQPPGNDLLPAPVSAEEALALYYGGEIEKSILEFEGLLARDPLNNRVRNQLIHLYREIGDYPRTIDLLGESWRLAEEGGPAIEEQLFIALSLGGRHQKAGAILPLSTRTGESLFYEGLLARDRGDLEKAATLLSQSLLRENRRPSTWFFLGQVIQELDPAEAETAYRTALKLDGSLTAVLAPLADTVLAQGRTEEAYQLFLRAQASQPLDLDLSQRIAALKEELPGLDTRKEEAARKRHTTALPPRVKPSPVGDQVPQVRVGLAEALASVTVKTGADYQLGEKGREDHTPLLRGKGHQVLTVRFQGGEQQVFSDSDELLLRSHHPLVLEYSDPGATTLVFDFVSERGSFFTLTEDRSYRGRMEFHPRPEGLSLINSLGIEEYLYGVLPAEMPASWPAEALKAQALAARSYTLAYLGSQAARGFDLYGSVLSAAYRGVGGEHRATTAAVDATQGLYMTAGGKPLRAYYSANHGGYSEDSLFVWGSEAGMQAVPDLLVPARETFLPLDELEHWIRTRPPSYSAMEKLHYPVAYRWEKWIAAEEIVQRLAQEVELGQIVKIISRDRGISGRVKAMEVIGTKGSVVVKGDRIRSRLGGLRSNLFVHRPKMGPQGLPEYFVFYGAGWGHGVGMDQSGAAGMAQQGYTAEEILRHYYPRAERAEYKDFYRIKAR